MPATCPACGKSYWTKVAKSINCVCGTLFVVADNNTKHCLAPIIPPPLAQQEIDRRLSICKSGCEHWDSEKEGCKVCGTCASGQKMLIGLMRDPTKRCPHPSGSKWGQPTNPIKVAFLTPGLNVGGAERWMASLCQHFDTAKIHPAYVVVGQEKHLEAAGWFPKHTVVINKIDLLPEVLKRVDVLVSWGPVSLDERTKGATIPFIDVAHGTLGHWDGSQHNGFKVQEAIARQAIQAGAHLVAVNEECLLNYPEEYRSQVAIMPNGAELARVESRLTQEEAKASFGIPECQKVVLFVGRFAKEKNLQALVDAVEFLPGWTLLAAGPKYAMPDRTEGKMIVMPGSVDPPADLYRAADVLCMPSLHEAHSLTLIEANLAGVPVVSYDYPAMKHLTAKHGPLAWLVSVRCSPQELAAEIICAYERVDSPGHRDGGRAEEVQRIAKEHYTAEAMTKRWEEYILCVSQTAKSKILTDTTAKRSTA